MKTIKFDYNGNEINFETENDVMVNATEMAKVFGKDVYDFHHTESVQKFIKAFCQTDNCRFEDEFTANGKLIKVVKGNHRINGTWMHRIVAYKFAAWLDPFFEVWVYKTIDRLINQYQYEKKDAILQELTAKQLKEKAKEELLAKYPEASKYFDLEQTEKQAGKKRAQIDRAETKQYSLLFSNKTDE